MLLSLSKGKWLYLAHFVSDLDWIILGILGTMDTLYYPGPALSPLVSLYLLKGELLYLALSLTDLYHFSSKWILNVTPLNVLQGPNWNNSTSQKEIVYI